MSAQGQTSPLMGGLLHQILHLQDPIEIRRPPAILTPALIFDQESSLTEIIQRPADCSAGELQLPCYGLDRGSADAILIRAVLEVHIHGDCTMGQVRSID